MNWQFKADPYYHGYLGQPETGDSGIHLFQVQNLYLKQGVLNPGTYNVIKFTQPQKDSLGNEVSLEFYFEFSYKEMPRDQDFSLHGTYVGGLKRIIITTYWSDRLKDLMLTNLDWSSWFHDAHQLLDHELAHFWRPFTHYKMASDGSYPTEISWENILGWGLQQTAYRAVLAERAGQEYYLDDKGKPKKVPEKDLRRARTQKIWTAYVDQPTEMDANYHALVALLARLEKRKGSPVTFEEWEQAARSLSKVLFKVPRRRWFLQRLYRDGFLIG